MGMSNKDIRNYVNKIPLDDLREHLRDRMLDIQIVGNQLETQRLILNELDVSVATTQLGFISSVIGKLISQAKDGENIEPLKLAKIACQRLSDLSKT